MRKLRAFSLLEIMVSISVMAALAAVMMANSHGLPVSRQPLALVQMLQAECKRARSIAMAKQIPVALCFPCGSTEPQVQSFYCLQGNEPTGAAWTKRFSGDLPNAYLYVGQWPTASGATVSGTPDMIVSNSYNHSWGGYLNPVAAADPMLVFTPAGTAFSPNGLSHFGGAYHIVGCNGATCTGTGPSGSVSSISHPQTVVVSESGDCWLEPSMSDAGPSVSLVEGSLSSTVPAPPAPHPLVPISPVITETTSMPAPPGDTTAVLYPNDYVRMSLTAKSPDGSPLRISWQCTSGSFSSPVPTDMAFDPVAKTYTGIWEWHPEPGAAPNSYTLTATVESGLGGVASTSGLATVPVNVTPSSQQYCFYRELMANTGVLSQSNLCRVRTNGTGQHTIVPITAYQGEFIACRVVPSSVLNKVAFATVMDGGPTGVQGNIYVCNADGTNLRAVAQRQFAPSPWWGSVVNVDLLEPVWAPDKKSLVYSGYNGATGFYDLWMVDFRAANPVPIDLVPGNSTGDIFCPQFTADSKHLVYLRGNFMSVSTNVNSDLCEVETCDWTAPGHPYTLLYTNPTGRPTGYCWGMQWPSANLKMSPNPTAGGPPVCLYMVGGAAPGGGGPTLADYGDSASAASGWPVAANGHFSQGGGQVSTGYYPGQGVTFLSSVDPGSGPGHETYVNTVTAGTPVGTLGSMSAPLVGAKFSPDGNRMVGQVYSLAGDNTRNVVVCNSLGSNSSAVTMGHLDNGVFFWDVPQYTFTADGKWVYYYSWNESNWFVTPSSGNDYNFWATPVDGSAPPKMITRMTPGVIRRNL